MIVSVGIGILVGKMGTRGFLIFKYNGVYYVIYNHYDSYVREMGVATVAVLKNLCKEFNGNVTLARLHLRTLFDAVVTRSAEAKFDANLRGEILSDHVIIWGETCEGFSLIDMKNPRSVVEFEDVTVDRPHADIFIEYMWEIDLDAGRFGMGTTYSETVLAQWSWKALYLMPLSDWQEEADLHCQAWRRNKIIIGSRYTRMLKLILLQAHIRRFLALRRALQPPDGYLFIKAKREFEELQNLR